VKRSFTKQTTTMRSSPGFTLFLMLVLLAGCKQQPEASDPMQHSDDPAAPGQQAIDDRLDNYLQTCQDSKAQSMVDSVLAIEAPIRPDSASAYLLASVEPRWTLERHDWAAAAEIVPRKPEDFPWDDFPAFEALSHFAIALGAAHTGDHSKATQSILRLGKLAEQIEELDRKHEVGAMRMASRAWLHEATGRPEKAEELMQQSAGLEAQVSNSQALTGAVLPAAELLGDMLLAHDKPAEALEAYRSSLQRSPNRFNSLFGAGKSAESMGDTETAAGYFRQIVEMCDGADTDRPELAYAKGFAPS
jgi:tetratricopeptide (TPR) repeat protein